MNERQRREARRQQRASALLQAENRALRGKSYHSAATDEPVMTTQAVSETEYVPEPLAAEELDELVEQIETAKEEEPDAESPHP